MINYSPWLFNARRTAANMTGRNSRGQSILQGRRAKGTFTPSNGTLSAHVAAALIWPLFQHVPGFIREFFTGLSNGQTAASQFYAHAYTHAFTPDGSGGGSLDEAAIAYAKGTMTPTSILTFTGDVSDNALNFTWPAAVSDSSQNATDVPWYVIRNITQDKTLSGSVGAVRSAGASGAVVPPAGFLVAG
ncbi:MAG TPA: hypothetical protein VLG09_06355, partial [Candidatus Saccharimonadales bacterium]|nr:hypothetical protein [Candidatus Saccharimonadales bacterium]